MPSYLITKHDDIQFNVRCILSIVSSQQKTFYLYSLVDISNVSVPLGYMHVEIDSAAAFVYDANFKTKYAPSVFETLCNNVSDLTKMSVRIRFEIEPEILARLQAFRNAPKQPLMMFLTA